MQIIAIYIIGEFCSVAALRALWNGYKYSPAGIKLSPVPLLVALKGISYTMSCVKFLHTHCCNSY